MGANAARASKSATENTQKLCCIRINSYLPCPSAPNQIDLRPIKETIRRRSSYRAAVSRIRLS